MSRPASTTQLQMLLRGRVTIPPHERITQPQTQKIVKIKAHKKKKLESYLNGTKLRMSVISTYSTLSIDNVSIQKIKLNRKQNIHIFKNKNLMQYL